MKGIKTTSPSLPWLQGVSFAVFGLGNRQYEHFCAMGRKVSKAMRVGVCGVGGGGDGGTAQIHPDAVLCPSRGSLPEGSRAVACLLHALPAALGTPRRNQAERATLSAGPWAAGSGCCRGHPARRGRRRP